MSNNINLLKRLSAVFGLLILSTMTPVYAQSVESISGEVLKDVSADELYWVAEVTCEGAEGARSMQQRAGENLWCAVNFPQLCRASKDSLAEQLCGPEYLSLASPSVTELSEIDATQEQDNQVAVDQTPIIAAPIITAPIITAPVVRSEPESAIQTIAEPENVVESVAIEPSAQQSIPASSAEIISSSSTSPSINSSNETLMTAEEIAIEEELILIEQQMIELRLEEIELE